MGGWVLIGNITNSVPNWGGLGLGLSLAKLPHKGDKSTGDGTKTITPHDSIFIFIVKNTDCNLFKVH